MNISNLLPQNVFPCLHAREIILVPKHCTSARMLPLLRGPNGNSEALKLSEKMNN